MAADYQEQSSVIEKHLTDLCYLTRQQINLNKLLRNDRFYVAKHWSRALSKTICCMVRRKKKIPVVPVSYREKIRVGRSEINFFLNIFFMVLAFFCWAICNRVPTSIFTRDAYFLWTNLGNLVQ
jgi:hypothetical protein